MDWINLKAETARKGFLKNTSFYNGDLPEYFDFSSLLGKISKKIKGVGDFKNFCTKEDDRVNFPSYFKDVCYDFSIMKNKDDYRPIKIIHPFLYVYLVRLITTEKSWNYLCERGKLLTKNSIIKCFSDMYFFENKNKEKSNGSSIKNWLEKIERESIKLSLEYDYLCITDISNCYGTIYTHSISWALHGKQECKKKIHTKDRTKLLGDFIDTTIQGMNYGQTNGIPQGSVLMDFLAERILLYVDTYITDKILTEYGKNPGIEILRYRDDYRIFSNNNKKVSGVLKIISTTLNEFGMSLSSEKTKRTNMEQDVIDLSIKSDKVFRKISLVHNKTLFQELLIVKNIGKKFPGSGSVRALLTQLGKRLEDKSIKIFTSEIDISISLLVNIILDNTNAHHIGIGILSKILYENYQGNKIELITKILKKFSKLEKTGHLEVWMQRLILNIEDSKAINSPEKLCQSLYEPISLWDSNWLVKKYRDIIETEDIIDREKVKEMTKRDYIYNEEYKVNFYY